MQARASFSQCGGSVFTAKIPGSVGFVGSVFAPLDAKMKICCIFNVYVYVGPIIWRNIGEGSKI